MNWGLIIDDDAKKQLSKIPKKEAHRIGEGIGEILIDPYSGDIQKIKGEREIWRRRIGSYRVLYKLYKLQSVVYVFEIERRTSKTY